MSGHCDKYEGLFIFGEENSLIEHLKECEICKTEHEKMLKTARLVKEVKYHFNPDYKILSLTAGLLATVLVFFSVNAGVLTVHSNKNIAYVEEKESIISEMGLPVDDYGLLLVD